MFWCSTVSLPCFVYFLQAFVYSFNLRVNIFVIHTGKFLDKIFPHSLCSLLLGHNIRPNHLTLYFTNIHIRSVGRFWLYFKNISRILLFTFTSAATSWFKSSSSVSWVFVIAYPLISAFLHFLSTVQNSPQNSIGKNAFWIM